MPTPRMMTQARQVQPANLADASKRHGWTVTYETVMATQGKRVMILGVWVPTGDNLQSQVGDIVTVLWKHGKPFFIYDMRVRRGSALGAPTVPTSVVEELFIATNSATGQLDVFFRNDQQITPLGLSGVLIQPPTLGTSNNTVQWGQAGDRFLVFNNSDFHSKTIYVFKLNRTANKVLTAKATAKLETTYILDSIAGSPATVNFQQVPGVTGDGFPVPPTALTFGLFPQVTYYFHSDTNTWDTNPRAPQSTTLTVNSFPNTIYLDERAHLIIGYQVKGQANTGTPASASLTSSMLVDFPPLGAAPVTIFTPLLQGVIPSNTSTTSINLLLFKVYSMLNGLPLTAVQQSLTVGFVQAGKFLAGFGSTGGVISAAASLVMPNVQFGGNGWPRTQANHGSSGQALSGPVGARGHVLWVDTSNNVFIAFFTTTGFFGPNISVGSTAADVAAFFGGGFNLEEYHPVRVLPTDYMYQSVNSPPSKVLNQGGLYFVQAWLFNQPSTIKVFSPASLVSGGFPTPGAKEFAMKDVGTLKKLPPTITDYPEVPAGPTTFEQFMSWHVVDDSVILQPIGRFIKP